MSSDNSAKPILVAGAIGTVCLLGVAWMYTASSSRQAVVNAEQYALERAGAVDANFTAKVESSEGAEPALVKPVAELQDEDKETAPAESDAKAEEEAEVAKAEEEAQAVEAAKAEEEAKAAEAAKAEEETQVAEAAKAEEEAKAAEAAKAEEEAEAAEAAKAEETQAAEAAKAEEEAKAAEAEKAEEPAAAPAAATQTASVDGDAAAGKKVFRKCKACHQIGDKAKNRVGPELNGIIGRTMGSVEDFKYSDVFQTAMADGKVWTVEDLDAWLKKPKDFMPGNKMAFGGLRKDKDRANVIAYLATNGE